MRLPPKRFPCFTTAWRGGFLRFSSQGTQRSLQLWRWGGHTTAVEVGGHTTAVEVEGGTLQLQLAPEPGCVIHMGLALQACKSQELPCHRGLHPRSRKLLRSGFLQGSPQRTISRCEHEASVAIATSGECWRHQDHRTSVEARWRPGGRASRRDSLGMLPETELGGGATQCPLCLDDDTTSSRCWTWSCSS